MAATLWEGQHTGYEKYISVVKQMARLVRGLRAQMAGAVACHPQDLEDGNFNVLDTFTGSGVTMVIGSCQAMPEKAVYTVLNSVYQLLRNQVSMLLNACLLETPGSLLLETPGSFTLFPKHPGLLCHV